jgi:hypothetical protein
MATKREGVSCYDKAGPDEPLFVLRSTDLLSPEIVREWAYRAKAAGTSDEKVEEARRAADAMEDWQIANSKKVPD